MKTTTIWKDYGNLILSDGTQAMIAICLDHEQPQDCSDPFDERVNEHVIAEHFWNCSAEEIEIISVLIYRLDLDAPEEQSVQGELLPELCYWYFGDAIAVATPKGKALRAYGLKSTDQVAVEYQGKRLPYREVRNS